MPTKSSVPSKVQTALYDLVHSYGVTVAVKYSGVSWTVFLAAGFGLPISDKHYDVLLKNLKSLGYL